MCFGCTSGHAVMLGWTKIETLPEADTKVYLLMDDHTTKEATFSGGNFFVEQERLSIGPEVVAWKQRW
jgi:hypothetical protein